jgi:hypothetical protein
MAGLQLLAETGAHFISGERLDMGSVLRLHRESAGTALGYFQTG